MDDLYLIARIDDTLVAIKSATVESVIQIQDVVPVPDCNPLVAGLFALRSRVLTLIDTQYLVSGTGKSVVARGLALVTEIGGHCYGLLVDSVQDVGPLDQGAVSSQIKPSANWQAIVKSVGTVGGEMVLVLDPEMLVVPALALAA